jgi:hypothetical protein
VRENEIVKPLPLFAYLLFLPPICYSQLQQYLPDRIFDVADDSILEDMDRSGSDRRQGSGKSRRKTDDPAMKKMFEDYGFDDERAGDRRLSTDRRDESSVNEIVEGSGKSPGYIE